MIESQPLGRREIGISLFLLILLTLSLRLPLIGSAPMMDELYHFFAAKSWLAEGELAIADGVYTRASGYTKLIAFAFGLFGEHIEVQRMIGVIAAVATSLLLFFWARTAAGAVAAWIAALLFCFWPDGITVSVEHRFYPLHGLFFLGGAIGVYLTVAMRDEWGRSALIAVGIGAAVLLGLALALQEATLIGIAGIGLWLGLVIGLPWLSRLEPGRRWLVVAGATAAALAGLAFVVLSGIGGVLLDSFRWTPKWAAESRNEFWYYHAFLTLYYPTLWSISGIVAIVAMARRPQLVGFCLAVFGTAFALHSLGGMKHYRYLYYVMPFLFVIWGVAIAFVIERFWPFFSEAADRTLDVLAPGLPRRPLRIGLIGGALLFTLFANAATIKTMALLAGVTVPPMTQPPAWDAARDELEPWLEGAVLLTTSEMETLYAFDRYDILISHSRMSELERHENGRRNGVRASEFSLDWRTGRPVISDARSLELVMSCFDKGVIVSNVYRWRLSSQLDDEVADLIEERAIPVELPGSTQITAYRWENGGSDASPACAELAAHHPAPPLPGSDGDRRADGARVASDSGGSARD